MISSRLINIAKHNHGANQILKNKARDLRSNMTGPEKILWSHIRSRKQNGMYFRRQHPYGIYILDFYCFEANLVIEVDGKIHLGRQDYDLERTEYLQSSGLEVLRFTNSEIETKIDWVIKKINSFSTKLPQLKENHHFPLGGNKKGGNKGRITTINIKESQK